MIHKAIVMARQGKNTPAEFFNTNTLEKIIDAFETIFAETYNQKFTYQSFDYTAQTSLFKDGDFVSELNQTYLGTNIAKDETIDKTRYLYDKVVYDSEIEHEVLKVPLPPQVIVYGKLPRKSIRLPTYTGGITSPDFVYTTHGQKPDDVHLHLAVETKSDNLRQSDNIATATQKKFFDCTSTNIKNDYRVNISTFSYPPPCY
jgi:type III restriction enzyme